MTFSERMRAVLDQGVEVSKDAAARAGAKAKDLGERGLLMVEIKQIEGQARRQVGRLGSLVLEMLTERGRDSVGKDDPEVRLMLDELAELKASIERKEAELKIRRA